jgi:CheY-like chemotaxis protein
MRKKSPNTEHKNKPRPQLSGRKPSGSTARRPGAKTRAELRSASKTRKRILLVDDDPEILELFSELLSAEGYQVDRAAHALGAICAVIRHPPDLILADIRMPIVDGAELALELKRHRDSCHIPVVALTGYDTPGMRESALQAGYDEYITKPIVPRKFLRQLATLLRQGTEKRAANSV